jgi:hypothetical protein
MWHLDGEVCTNKGGIAVIVEFETAPTGLALKAGSDQGEKPEFTTWH